MKKLIFVCVLFFDTAFSFAANIAYIHGDVAPDGTIPAGNVEPYDQMLLADTGNTGLSKFKALVESQGHTIVQHYDADTILDSAFLDGYAVVIFGLHQKLWSAAEKSALDLWLKAGGGMLIYSDSASGGFYATVGAQNPVGQTTTNNLITPYGMQVTVDQANGVKQTTAVATSPTLVLDGLTLEGEGVSPAAVADSPNNEVLIPFTETINHTQNITLTNPSYAALALRIERLGHIAVMFDRQPMWNNGPGSDIEEEGNAEILRRLINFLAESSVVNPEPPISPTADVPISPILLLLDE